MSVRALTVSAAAALVLTATATTPTKAQSVADFYRGKTISYNLAVPDGASWGLYARTFIEHNPEYADLIDPNVLEAAHTIAEQVAKGDVIDGQTELVAERQEDAG